MYDVCIENIIFEIKQLVLQSEQCETENNFRDEFQFPLKT